MKQRWLSLLLVVLVVSSMGMVGVAGAQDDVGNESNSTNETDAGDESEAPEEGSEVWTLYRVSNNTTSDGDIKQRLGPNIAVQSIDYHPDGTADIVFVAERTTTLSIQDSSALDFEKSVSRGRIESKTIPRGTYRLVVPATVQGSEGLQAVSVTHNGWTTQFSNQNVESSWFEGKPLWRWFAYFLVAAAAGAAIYLVRRMRKMDRGAITTSEGIELGPEFQFGLERLPETDDAEPEEGGEER